MLGEERQEQTLFDEYINTGEQLMEHAFNAGIEHNAKPQLFDVMNIVVLTRKL